MNKGFNNLEAREILENNDNILKLMFTIPPESLYFEGHFPGDPILPAVAQVDIVLNFASRYFGTGIAVTKIKRMKFTKIIRPSFTILLRIEKKENVLNFKLTTQNESEIYSSGAIYLDSAAEKM